MCGANVTSISGGSPENNAKLILEKLQSVAAPQQTSFGFEAFNQEHSLEALLARTSPSWLREIDQGAINQCHIMRFVRSHL